MEETVIAKIKVVSPNQDRSMDLQGTQGTNWKTEERDKEQCWETIRGGSNCSTQDVDDSR